MLMEGFKKLPILAPWLIGWWRLGIIGVVRWAPTLINVSLTEPMMSPVGSASSASAQAVHLGDHLRSFLFSQNHWLLIPRSLNSLTVDVATKSRHPTSTGQIIGVHVLFCLCCKLHVLQLLPLEGFVYSTLLRDCKLHIVVDCAQSPELDHSTGSSLKLVVAFSDRTVSRWPTSASICQLQPSSNCPTLNLGGIFLSLCSPSQMKAGRAGLVILGGKARMVVLLLHCCKFCIFL